MKIRLRRSLKFVLFTISTILFLTSLYTHTEKHQLHPLVLDHETFMQLNSKVKYLSYQPCDHGWNNQRIVFEHAVVFAKLLNRTLIVHPVSPHPLGQNMVRRMRIKGYEAYNMMNRSQLLPISRIIDLNHLSKLVPIVENTKPHPEFVNEFSHLNWHSICHSVAYGFWIDRRPATPEEKFLIDNQFLREKKDMEDKCRNVRGAVKPIVKFIFPDLLQDDSDIIYFSEGTLFAIDVRFFSEQLARNAQTWISDFIRYHPKILATVDTFISHFLPTNYCSLHARRSGHTRGYLTSEYFLNLTQNLGCAQGNYLYIATDLLENSFFEIFNNYKLLNSTSFLPLIDLDSIPEHFHLTWVGIHEQMVCVSSSIFVPSNHSTLSYYVRRMRKEVPQRDGLLLKYIYFYYINHYEKEFISKFYI